MSRLGVGSGATSVVLAGVAALHVGWACGSTWPFPNATALADTVVGAPDVPPPAACFAVAGALATAAALVAGVPARAPLLRKVGQIGVASVLAARAGLGFAGRTDLAVRGSASPRFRRWDRRLYSPLCLALAAGAAHALTK
ncbi:MAG: DUF3995 domain-containing protein [Actinomycetota bacterium]|nr:DUF3995 domain-containing protein [Actinomycetota bacterium]